MSELTPRLLNEDAARAYHGGRNPRTVMPPVKLGGRNCWDRVALDRKLDQIFGLTRATAHVEDSALERWRRKRHPPPSDAETSQLTTRRLSTT